MSGVALTIEHASKRYAAQTVLDDVGLAVQPGEFLSVLGPSGSGKTTLLNAVAGFSRLDGGRILFDGEDVTDLPPHRRGIGVVFQNYALFPHLDVAQNVAFPLRARRLPAASHAAKVEQALRLVELDGFQARRISQLSGGQCQRVALARALVFDPRLVLMDEPLSALDKRLRETMQIELRKLHQRLGVTIVYVTHDQREALTMSDRIAVMRRGRLVQVDTPRRLYERPADAFVADFIGDSTLVDVQRVDAGTVAFRGRPVRCAGALPAGDALRLVLPADRLQLGAGLASGELNVFEGTLAELAYQGDSWLAEVELGDGARVRLRSSARHGSVGAFPSPGAPVRFGLHVEDTVVVPLTETSA